MCIVTVQKSTIKNVAVKAIVVENPMLNITSREWKKKNNIHDHMKQFNDIPIHFVNEYDGSCRKAICDIKLHEME